MVLAALGVLCTIVVKSRTKRTYAEIKPGQSMNSDLPLPPGGLPDGWTIEQWYYYGEEYMRGER